MEQFLPPIQSKPELYRSEQQCQHARDNVHEQPLATFPVNTEPVAVQSKVLERVAIEEPQGDCDGDNEYRLVVPVRRERRTLPAHRPSLQARPAGWQSAVPKACDTTCSDAKQYRISRMNSRHRRDAFPA